MRLQRGKVKPYDPFVVRLRVRLNLGVGREQVAVFLGNRRKSAPVCGFQVRAHMVVVGEHRGGGAYLSAHIRDGSLARGADSARAGPNVLHDCVSAAGHGQLARHIQDNVLRRRPPAHFARQIDRDMARVQHFPGQARHNLNRVRAAHAYRAGAQPAGVGGVRIRANHQLAGKCVVFQRDLVDDARARTPEPRAVLGGGGAQEVVHLIVFRQRLAQVGRALYARLYQVVAVYRSGDGDRFALRLHKLQHPRLPQHVLQDNAVGAGEQVAFARYHLLRFGVVQMPQQNLVGERQRPVQPSAHHLKVALHRLINLRRHLRRGLNRNHCCIPSPLQ